jgi:hypothetical protein
MADSYERYVRKSKHSVKPGDLYFGEAVLQDPRQNPVYNHHTEANKTRLRERDWTDEQIEDELDSRELDDAQEKHRLVREWQAQDRRFADQENVREADEAAEREREQEEWRKKQDEKLAAWGGTKRDGIPDIEDVAPDTESLVYLSPSTRAAMSKLEFLNLTTFHPEHQESGKQAQLLNEADGLSGKYFFDPQNDGAVGWKAAGKQAKRAPSDLSVPLDYVMVSMTYYIPALEQLQFPRTLIEGWAAVQEWIQQHPRRGTTQGDETLCMALYIHRQDWHTVAVNRAPTNPRRLATNLVARAETRINETNREEHRRMMEAVSAYPSMRAVY